MTKRNIFYSFHFDNDVMRVQQVRNMGVVDGNTPVTPNDWEKVKKGGDAAIKRWIEENLSGKSCLVVLIGEQTSKRPWVQYEIKRAWEEGKGVLGIYVHNIRCPNNGTCSKGANPFNLTFKNSKGAIVVPATYDPVASDAYNDLKSKLPGLIEAAIKLNS